MPKRKKPVVRAWMSPNEKIAYVWDGKRMFGHTREVQWCSAVGVAVEMMPALWGLPAREARRLDAQRRKATGGGK